MLKKSFSEKYFFPLDNFFPLRNFIENQLESIQFAIKEITEIKTELIIPAPIIPIFTKCPYEINWLIEKPKNSKRNLVKDFFFRIIPPQNTKCKGHIRKSKKEIVQEHIQLCN